MEIKGQIHLSAIDWCRICKEYSLLVLEGTPHYTIERTVQIGEERALWRLSGFRHSERLRTDSWISWKDDRLCEWDGERAWEI